MTEDIDPKVASSSRATRFENFNHKTKINILDITQTLFDSNNIEEIVTLYELGQLSKVEDIYQQMALVQLSEELLGETVIQIPIISEVVKNGRFLRSGSVYYISNKIQPGFIRVCL